MAVFRDFCRCFQRMVFVSALCVFSVFSFASASTLTYKCGDGTNTQWVDPNFAGDVTAPNQSDAVSNGCTVPLNLRLAGWVCGNIYYAYAVLPGGTIDWNGYDLTCEAYWGPQNGGLLIPIIMLNGNNPSIDNPSTYTKRAFYDDTLGNVYLNYNVAQHSFSDRMTPLPNANSHLVVPILSSGQTSLPFTGYYSTDSGASILNEWERIFNSYGELTYEGAQYIEHLRETSMSGLYSIVNDKTGSPLLKLDSSAADNGGHGTEFLRYACSDCFSANWQDVNIDCPTSAMNQSSNPITVPSRNGYVFAGYFSAADGGTRYIDESGYITSAGIYWLHNSCVQNSGPWYAHWCVAGQTIDENGECTGCGTGTESPFPDDVIGWSSDGVTGYRLNGESFYSNQNNSEEVTNNLSYIDEKYFREVIGNPNYFGMFGVYTAGQDYSIIGESACIERAEDVGVILPAREFAEFNKGEGCWCRISGFLPTDVNLEPNQSFLQNSNDSWVSFGNLDPQCEERCAEMCAHALMYDEETKMYSGVIDDCLPSWYNVSYYCNEESHNNHETDKIAASTSVVWGQTGFSFNNNSVFPDAAASRCCSAGYSADSNPKCFTEVINNGGTIGSSAPSPWNIDDDVWCLVECVSNSYTVTLNDNGGSGGSGTLYTLYAQQQLYSNSGHTTQANSVTKPSRSGYIFQGYYSASTGGTQYVGANGNILAAGKSAAAGYTDGATWYAQWKPVYTITLANCQNSTYTPVSLYAYDGNVYRNYSSTNGGSVTNQMTVSGNNSLSSLPSLTDATFDGFYSECQSGYTPTGTKYITSGGAINSNGITAASGLSGNTTWYAAFNITVNTYTLTYTGCGTGANPSDQTIYEGQSLTLANGCSGVSTSDVEFTGWYCVDGWSRWSIHDGGASVSFWGNTECRAVLQPTNPCSPGSTTYEVLGVPFDSLDDGTAEWNSGYMTLQDLWDSRASDMDITDRPAITYYENENYKVTWGAMCSVTPGIPTVAGNPSSTSGDYCWCQARGVQYPNGEDTVLSDYPWVMADPFENGQCNESGCYLHCLWMFYEIGADMEGLFQHSLFTKNICHYNLTYNCNNGNSNQSSLSGGTHEYDETVYLWLDNGSSVGSCSKPANKTFNGWNCGNDVTINNSGVSLPNIRMPNNNVTCTANWIDTTYSLFYHCGAHGTGSGLASSYVINTSVNTLSSASGYCTADTGYQANVTAWDCGGSDTNVTPGNPITMSSNRTCTALWTPNTYTIAYDLAGGSHGASHPTSATYDTTFTVSNPTRNGYTFSGWAITSMESGVTHYYGMNSVTAHGTGTSWNGITATKFKNLRASSGTVLFRATWSQQTYSLEYDCNNGANEGPYSDTIGSGTLITLPGTENILNKIEWYCTTPTGYYFDGWECEVTSEPASWWGYSAGDSFQLNNDITCHAIWREIQCASPAAGIAAYDVLGQMVDSLTTPAETMWNEDPYVSLRDVYMSAFTPSGPNSDGLMHLRYNYGADMDVVGICTNVPGTVTVTADDPGSDGTGNHCWCKVKEFSYNGIEALDYPWTFFGNFTAMGRSCDADECIKYCIESMTKMEYMAWLWKSMFVKPICGYNVYYDCGDCTGTGSSCNIGPTDNNMYVAESLVDLSSTVSPCSYPSHSFSGSWECNELDANNQITNSVFVENGQIKMPAANVQCSPVWDAIIGLLWKSLTNASPTTPVTVTSNQSTCIYGRDNDITPIAPPPARTGYTFKGWKVTSHQQ